MTAYTHYHESFTPETMNRSTIIGALAIACLLSWPLKSSAQIFLTPLGVRSVVLLNDHLTDCRDELAVFRCNAELDSIELSAARVARDESVRLLKGTETQLKDCGSLVKIGRDRETELETALSNASKVAKRRERLAYVLAGVAAAEAVVIGIAYGLR
jgi:hypothetical protein